MENAYNDPQKVELKLNPILNGDDAHFVDLWNNRKILFWPNIFEDYMPGLEFFAQHYYSILEEPVVHPRAKLTQKNLLDVD